MPHIDVCLTCKTFEVGWQARLCEQPTVDTLSYINLLTNLLALLLFYFCLKKNQTNTGSLRSQAEAGPGCIGQLPLPFACDESEK